MYMDRHPSKWWGKYKIPTKETITDIQMLPCVILNHMFLNLTGLLYICKVGRGFNPSIIPSYYVLLEVVGYFLIYELFFYYGHRLLHVPGIYSAIHKLHHLTKGSTGISGFYMHPVDFYFETVIPFFMAPALLNGHMVSLLVWAGLSGINSPHSHGGYQFPFLPPPDNHYIHHKVFHSNYGLGVLDVVHNTQKTNIN